MQLVLWYVLLGIRSGVPDPFPIIKTLPPDNRYNTLEEPITYTCASLYILMIHSYMIKYPVLLIIN